MSLIPWAPSQWTDDLGRPLAFGRLYLYQAGTLIPKATYQDAAHTVAHTFPIVLDATGRSNVWLIDDEAYDLVVHDSDGNVMRSVLGILTNGAPTNPAPTPTDPFSAAIESFKEGKINWISDPDSDIFRDDGCFCWIIPAKNILSINWFKTVSAQNANVSIGKFSIWAAPDTLLADGVKLYEGPVPDNASPGIVSLGLDCSGYEWIGVACDPGLIGGGIPIEQTGLVLPNDIPNSPRFFGYVGQHAHNTTFASFPPIYAVDTKYMMTRYMQLGVTFEGAST